MQLFLFVKSYAARVSKIGFFMGYAPSASGNLNLETTLWKISIFETLSVYTASK